MPQTALTKMSYIRSRIIPELYTARVEAISAYNLLRARYRAWNSRNAIYRRTQTARIHRVHHMCSGVCINNTYIRENITV